jgi:hypothetical protein
MMDVFPYFYEYHATGGRLFESRYLGNMQLLLFIKYSLVAMQNHSSGFLFAINELVLLDM